MKAIAYQNLNKHLNSPLVVVHQATVWVPAQSDSLTLAAIQANLLPTDIVYLDGDYVLVYLKEREQISSNDSEWLFGKQLLSIVEPSKAKQLLRAIQWLTWDANHQHCPRCGESLRQTESLLEKSCPNCSNHLYPNLSPAVMILVKRDDEILLARSPHYRPGMYSALAGFIEPGETAEEAAAREVMEETGITIKNLTYFGTQSWPFPASFMIAFYADYESGDLTVDHEELEEAYWCPLNSLPDLPYEASIAHRLITSLLFKTPGIISLS